MCVEENKIECKENGSDIKALYQILLRETKIIC